VIIPSIPVRVNVKQFSVVGQQDHIDPLPNFQVDRVRCYKISGDAQVNESLGVGAGSTGQLAINLDFTNYPSDPDDPQLVKSPASVS